MNDSNDSSIPNTPRATLRLKVTPRSTPPAIKTQAPPRQLAGNKAKPGARWSDDYKERMQADMDALTSR